MIILGPSFANELFGKHGDCGDHKEGSVTLGSACSSTNEAFFLVVDTSQAAMLTTVLLKHCCLYAVGNPASNEMSCYFAYLLFLCSTALWLV